MTVFLSLLTYFASSDAASCGPEPFALPIKDVQVRADVPNSLMRGIPAKIGSPEQDIVLLPWA